MTSNIVCIHGAGGGGWEYAKWTPVFTAAGYRVIANDLEPAAAGLAATTAEEYLAQIQDWLPAEEPVILVGASMGGLLALKVAEQIHPAALLLGRPLQLRAIGVQALAQGLEATRLDGRAADGLEALLVGDAIGFLHAREIANVGDEILANAFDKP